MNCSQCDFEIQEGAKFCPKCGTPIVAPEPDEPEAQGTVVCPSCDKEFVATAKFCPGCGKPVLPEQETVEDDATGDDVEDEATEEEVPVEDDAAEHASDESADAEDSVVEEDAGAEDNTAEEDAFEGEAVEDDASEQTDEEETPEGKAPEEETSEVGDALEDEPPVIEQVAYCATCDKEHADTAKFCPNCGNALELRQAEPEQEKSKRSGKKLGIGIGIAAIVVVAVVIALVVAWPMLPGTPQAEINPLAAAEVGDVVNLGEVSYTNSAGDTVTEDIGWQVLAVEDGRSLVTSENIIDVRPYISEEATTADWSESEVRTWLNSDFYEGLPEFIQTNAQSTKIQNASNAVYGVSGGVRTEDIVFILSIEEAIEYYATDEERRVSASSESAPFASTIQTYSDESAEIAQFVEEYGTWPWWVRASGVYGGTAFVVDFDGALYMRYGDFEAGVRPAMWISNVQE